MKLIIAIPDNVYAKVIEYYEHNEIVKAVYSYIYRGIPLDKIRAEIEQLHCHPKLDFIKNDEVVDMALEIIDRQIGDKE